MGEITVFLRRASAGDGDALDAVFAALYPELRQLARGRAGRAPGALTPTALVHEAYMRLVGNRALRLNDREHFFACAARAMRAIAIDELRRDGAAKRGGDRIEVTFDEGLAELDFAQDDLLLIDAALDALERISPRQCRVVELRFFAGLEFAEIAALFDCSLRTAKREWERARAFLYARLEEPGRA
ncbi:sigma-70 family RNA polymerase sigma factor [Luteimonas sp. SJ-92]|uniref:Sigma-70 family RNA polymerase sigma factor n=1 Tax=Luteimonas salinisoli TaxID=2752307 RepID=A0A853JA33_9GAMM|nr:ECF-type sigma factor [Luteimonas salinisoli]NZA25715.1 sigma-70 family RNA polymerase sigma factor [Luteimonas salinisoli]